MKQRLNYLDFEEESLKNIPHLRLSYEDDLSKGSVHQKTMEKVFGFLNVDNVVVKTRLKKINQYKAQEIILNYDELKKYFRNSIYSSFMVD
ncbi:MAG: hypothetical protein AAF960_25870 [Bacteroidota bacterium]